MLTFAHSWLFLLLPLPLLVRWLPPFHTARPAVRLPFFAQLAEVTGRRPEAGAAIQRRSAVQGIVYVVIWCALIAALARPQWLEPPLSVQYPRAICFWLWTSQARWRRRILPVRTARRWIV